MKSYYFILFFIFCIVNSVHSQCVNPLDCDQDTVINTADQDDDNDGILDSAECAANTASTSVTGTNSANSNGGHPFTSTVAGNNGTSGETLSNYRIETSTGTGDIYDICVLRFNTSSFDDGIQLIIDGNVVLEFNQWHWDNSRPATPNSANTTEFNAGGRFDSDGNGLWTPWTGEGNPEVIVSAEGIFMFVDTALGTREDALPFMDTTVGPTTFIMNNSIPIDCEAGIDVIIGNSNHQGPGGIINLQMSVDTYVCVDTDGDGIADKFDTDSDNDNCADAVEGAGNFQIADLTSSNNLADNDEGNIGADGVPSNAGSPQTSTAAVLDKDDFSACEADLSLTKTVNNTISKIGDTIIYTLTLKNSGPLAATNIQVTDVLPSGLQFLSSNSPKGSYSDATGVWDLSLETIAVNEIVSLQISAQILSPSIILNTAEITQLDQLDPDSVTNNGN